MPVEVIRYTPEELIHLRDSPLIQKPDGLPAIEQWMEPAPEQNQRKGGRTQGGRNDDAAQANENGSRPSLFPGKHFARHSSTAPEDIVLGPPKMAFASSSRVPKMADSADKDDDAKDIRDKFFKDREERKNGALNGRRGRDDGEGWTNVRGRKASFSEDPDRPPRIGGRFNRDNDGEEVAPRRNGARGRFEQPWGRDNADSKEADGGHGSWRDRRDNRDREWARGGNNNRVEEEPEWYDTPVAKKKDEIGMARFKRNQGSDFFDDGPQDGPKAKTQEDFQRWKEQMKAGKPLEEKESAPEPAPARDTPTSSKPITPMVLDGKDMFGMWGAAVKQESPATTEGAPAPPKPKGPAKQSKFAKLFTPQEEQQQQQQQQQPQQLPQPSAPEPNFGIPNGNNEDKEGFQRILQMLGNTSINTQSPSQGSAAPSRKPSMFSPLETRSPDRDTVHVQPQPTRHHILRSREEKAGFIESVLAPRGTPTEFKGPQGAFGPFTPTAEPGQEQMRQESRPESIRSPEERMAQSTPGSNGMGNFGLQSLLTSQPPPHATQLSRDREFLLNLMTQPQRNTPPQPPQVRPPPPELFTNFMDTKGMPPRANPPPGLFEDRQFPENDVRYQPQPRRMPDNPEIENAMRRAGRFNLPVHVDDPAIAGLQRRNTGDAGIPRGQMTNMGIPQQPPPDQMWSMKPPGLQQPQDRPPVSNMAPPPGFPAAANNMGGRGPPGFGGPNNMPPFSAGNTPLGHPGMGVQRGPPGTGPASAGPGPSPGMFSPPGHGGPLHGYFGPPQGPPPPPGFGGPGPMGMGAGPGPHHEQMQQMLGLRGGAGGPPPGMAGPGGMGMGIPGQRIPGAMGQGPGPNGFDFFENQRRGSHVQGPFGM